MKIRHIFAATATAAVAVIGVAGVSQAASNPKPVPTFLPYVASAKALSSTTVHAGDNFQIQADIKGNVQAPPGVTLYYQKGDGTDMAGISDVQGNVTIPADWKPGQYHLQHIETHATRLDGTTAQFRSKDLFGYVVTGSYATQSGAATTSLDLAKLDLTVKK